MKTTIAIAFFFLTASVYSKDIPSPFWYTITQKILMETQDYILSEGKVIDKTTPVVSTKQKVVHTALLCERRKDLFQLPFLKLKSDPLWQTADN